METILATYKSIYCAHVNETALTQNSEIEFLITIEIK